MSEKERAPFDDDSRSTPLWAALPDAELAPERKPPHAIALRTTFNRSRVVDRISDLAVFIRTAETGNYSEAARLLSLSPSAVSKLISRLEDRMGVRLFNRTSRALSLTCDGEAFYEKALRIVAVLEEAENIAPSGTEQIAGKLRIYCPPCFANHLLVPLLPDFAAEYPRVRIEFMLGDEAIDPVAANIDVIVQIGALTDSSFIARRIGTARFIYCASPDFLQRRGDQVDIRSALLNLSPARRSSSRAANEDRRMVGAAPESGLAASDAEMLRQLALLNMGVARLPDFVARNDMATGSLLHVPGAEESEEDQPIFAIYPARKNLPGRTRSFIDFLSRRLKDNPWPPVQMSMPTLGGDQPSSEAAPTLSLLYVAHLVSAAGFSDQRRAAGLDVTQSRVLIALAEYGELTPNALANVIMLHCDIVEDTLRQLANRGLLTRTGSGLVTLTEEGKETQSSVQRQWRLYEEKQLSRFSATDVAIVRRFFGSYIRRFGPRLQEH